MPDQVLRDYAVLYMNSQRTEVRGAELFQPLSTYLRVSKGLVGTKVVCAEGDCGACTVLIARAGDNFTYRSVNSCIQYMYQLDGASIITIEALKEDDALHPVQQAMVECHGSQCGFCTPGFVMSLAGVCEGDARPNEETVRSAVVGNLCRCTGYLPIIHAGCGLEPSHYKKIAQRFHTKELLKDLTTAAGEAVLVRAAEKTWFKPVTIAAAVKFRAQHPQATILAGATDLGVRMNKCLIDPTTLMTVNSIAELAEVKIENGVLIAGAAATWGKLEKFVGQTIPEFARILDLFGSPQIRAAGTIGGNIANASPIADSLPMLYVLEAELEIAGPAGSRRLPIDKFYRGYKVLDLKPDELIARVHIPLPKKDDILRLYKVSRRTHMDISSFTAAVWMRKQDESIGAIRIAYGGVGPMVVRLTKTEEFLTGQKFTQALMQEAGQLAVTEVTPIPDVRGSQEYRNSLGENILVKFYYDCCMDEEAIEI
jgi:xanthine dehydrogenase small subunit